jgi:hypothetical protein
VEGLTTQAVVADKDFDADEFIESIKKTGAQAVSRRVTIARKHATMSDICILKVYRLNDVFKQQVSIF